MVLKEIKFSIQSLDSYVKEFNEDINITLANIREKSMLVSSIRSKWLMYFFKEKENLEKIKNKKKEVLEKKLTDFGKDVSILKIKNEEEVVKSSKAIQVLSKLESDNKACLDYI